MAQSLTLDHIAIHVVDMARSAHFYEMVLGLEPIPEPFHDGLHLWYRIGPTLSLHVVGDARTLREHPLSHHIAFRTPAFDATLERLEAHNILFRGLHEGTRLNTRADGIRQIYLQDPDGYWIEINDATA